MIKVLPYNRQMVAVYQGRVVRAINVPGSGMVEIYDSLVSMDDLDELYTETMEFDWKGQEFALEKYENGLLYGQGGIISLEEGRRIGLIGDPYGGWGCEAPEGEIQNLRVKKVDTLANWRYRREMGHSAPPGFYRYVRPATSEEWTRPPARP